MAFQKGKEKTGGRKPGTVNHATADVREGVAQLLQGNVENYAKWLKQVANGDDKLQVKADPGRALDIVAKLCEYHIPKLARTEVSGDVGLRVIKASVDDLGHV